MNTKALKCWITAAVVAVIGTSVHAAPFTWVGGVGNINSNNYDTGTNPFGNGTADDVYIASGGLSTNAATYDLDAQDTYHLSGTGQLLNTASGKNIFAHGATINVTDDAVIATPMLREAVVNLSGNGSLIARSGTGNHFRDSTINFDSTWTGSIFFSGYASTSAVIDWLDGGNGVNKFFLDGVALTGADEGVKFVLNHVTSGAPALASESSGVFLTLVAIPEPASLVLLGLGGLMIARRRRA